MRPKEPKLGTKELVLIYKDRYWSAYNFIEQSVRNDPKAWGSLERALDKAEGKFHLHRDTLSEHHRKMKSSMAAAGVQLPLDAELYEHVTTMAQRFNSLTPEQLFSISGPPEYEMTEEEAQHERLLARAFTPAEINELRGVSLRLAERLVRERLALMKLRSRRPTKTKRTKR